MATKYFNYQTAARAAKIPPDKMEKLLDLIRQEFPNDRLMFELHVLRACMAIRDGYVKLEVALNPEPEHHS